MNYDEKIKFLKSFLTLDTKIDLLIEEKQKWYDRALKITPSMSDMPKSNGFYDKTANSIEKVVILEKQIDDAIDRLVDDRERITNAINKLDDITLGRLLYMKYIGNMSFEKISRKIGYCEKQISRLHKKAVETIDL